ncbi:uncharacterized protein B0H64DRAFT_330349 [Chaetomium fimeti]|uniref:Uncharacterized protein n=1 Tax=Chaetomium fimeti TaxID=1854472 RepID=A0AAE0H7U1_9PEZI|nr:hypothetical protein B0H64DRAFT_330349 [Chaetomium fimeti]
MSTTDLVFVTTTGRPGLSRADTKLMRGHVTRSNFAKRRRRRAELQRAEHELCHTEDRLEPPVLKTQKYSIGGEKFRKDSPSPKSRINMSDFWSHFFLHGETYPASSQEGAWLQLLVSEAALAQVSLSIGFRIWSPNAAYQKEALACSSSALSIIMNRIATEQALTDAVMAAVLHMAVGERFGLDDEAWHVHIGGLAQLITARAQRGQTDLPVWFSNMIIFDAINAVFGFPLCCDKRLLDAVQPYGIPAITKVADMTQHLLHLRDLITAYHHERSPFKNEIDQKWAHLLHEARELRRSVPENPYVVATSLSAEILLWLCWENQLTPGGLTQLAGELRQAICRFPFRPCSFTEMVSCPMMLGAIAARPGSETRAWFVGRLRRSVAAAKSRAWARPLDMVEKKVCTGMVGGGRFEELWRELGADL